MTKEDKNKPELEESIEVGLDGKPRMAGQTEAMANQKRKSEKERDYSNEAMKITGVALTAIVASHAPVLALPAAFSAVSMANYAYDKSNKNSTREAPVGDIDKNVSVGVISSSVAGMAESAAPFAGAAVEAVSDYAAETIVENVKNKSSDSAIAQGKDRASRNKPIMGDKTREVLQNEGKPKASHFHR